MAASLILTAGVLGSTALVAAAPSADAATACPSGAVCIRETNGTILSKNIFYSYGYHNLSNVTGNRVVVNSQTGGAGFKVCLNYGGTNCSSVTRATGDYAPYNFTPINSIVLVA
ncbi:hypothetical protein [Nocardioides plantarum]|uniref:Peptidase inhibitor family I36 n=1 Tax=Nocardioides plantarum TaxID=29299 RepID=A0ABV5KI29_9ACTN|nr:hypothetical protein [Nocardioides plantarum]